MTKNTVWPEGGAGDTGRQEGKTLLSGISVREDDLQEEVGLHITTLLFRVCAVIILLLALWQVVDWFLHRPPGGVGIGVLVGDTIRLVVFAGLLWAAGAISIVWVKTHHDMRAARILLARQTYMMRQMAIISGAAPVIDDPESERRGLEPEETVDPDVADES